jgi:alkylation response protein AidB-like acyl-CoA dehydrogenase
MMAASTPATDRVPGTRGGSFLFEQLPAATLHTPEDFSEEQRQTAATADRFMNEEVMPAIEDFEHHKPGLALALLKRAGGLGLLAVVIPEKYGGLEMDMGTAVIVAERVGRYASFSTTYGAHADIGTRPLLFFGTEQQKQKYLPKLAQGEMMAAYCLSEPHAGSDALAARTRADLSPDGKHYILNGEKMWISNGGWAGLYTVFAKVGGEKFTAFLVERGTPGVRPGSEEKKMGIKGSSTTPLVLDNAAVPIENVLGEVGRGHVIAFNTLNMGRLELGASCVGGGKDVLAESIRYAKQRKAFGRAIADFGLIQHKLAEMAAKLFAAESLVYRTSGLIDAQFTDFSWHEHGAASQALAVIEEFAIECSIAKVYCSEALDFIVDEGVQIHGGYGFHQDYAVERAYRDSRINRIFEGTNEINRLLIPGMLLKRGMQGRLELNEAIGVTTTELLASAAAGTTLGSGPDDALSRAKRALLWTTGIATQRFGKDIEQEQEILAALADGVIAIYATESAALRAQKLAARGRGDAAQDMATLLASGLLGEIRRQADVVLGACCESGTLDRNAAITERLTRSIPTNVVALRRKIAARLIAREKFVV